MKRRVLVIGCGSIGLRHLKNLSRNHTVEPAGLDMNPEVADEVQAFGYGIRFFSDFDSAAAWSPDLVIVATPNDLHRDNCLWAFGLGAHVLCEKPLATSVEEGESIVRAADEAGLKLGVGFSERYREAVQCMIDEAASGRLGNLVGGRAMVGTYNTLLCAKDPKHRGNSFGSLVLDYVHELDILAAVFGSVRRVECMGNSTAEKELRANPSLAAAIAEYENGAIVSIHFDYVQHPQRRCLEIYGDQGTLVYDFQEDVLKMFNCREPGYRVRRFGNVRDEQFIREHDDMLNAAANGTDPLVTGREGLKSLQVSCMLLDKLQL